MAGWLAGNPTVEGSSEIRSERSGVGSEMTEPRMP